MKSKIKYLLLLPLFYLQLVNAQESSFTSRISKEMKSTITLIGDTVNLRYHRIISAAGDKDKYSLFNLTDIIMNQDFKKLFYNFENLNNYWFIPFDDLIPVSLKEDFVYYECCGGCDAAHECFWYPSGNCFQCVCTLNLTPYGCIVTRYVNGHYNRGNGIIVKAESINVY